MFEIKEFAPLGSYYVYEGKKYLHSDGSVLETAEHWPTREAAQKVLDKYYPESEHVWVHGDVFRVTGVGNSIMMYLHPKKRFDKRKPGVIYIGVDAYAYGNIEEYLINTTFLFNIKEKL